MNIHTTTVPAHFTDLLALKPPKIAADRYAHRVRFEPVGEKGPGLVAKVPVPNEGRLRSIAVQPAGGPASGDLLLSIVDPACHYDAFFLYAVLEDVPLTVRGPVMWRRTDIHGAAYSSNQGTQGFLYLLILDGPTEIMNADIALTVETN